MRLPDPLLLGAIYGLSELYLAFTRRARAGATSRDRHSLILLWAVIIVSFWFGVQMVWLAPGATLPHPSGFYLIGFCLFLGGLILRYFTVDVSISAEHRLIDSGPYRFVRHPTYTGALLAFLGLGFCLGNWLSILFLSLPIIAVFLRRVRIEERALLGALGDQYRPYMRRTKRLIPFIY
jgi:protein-S-isoprenylcysteine O-methyltransferase